MTQEQKQLLLKDLCARLLSHTIVKYRNADVDLTQYARSIKFTECKPYLRPMSSMTKEEHEEFFEKWGLDGWNIDTFDWLNKYHFDYRGLILMGLALEAFEDMYNIK